MRQTRRVSGMILTLALAAGAIGTPTARAQVITVTGRSVEALIGELKYLAANVAPGEEGRRLVEGLEKLGESEMLKGVDQARPFGVYASLPKQAGGPPSVTAFVPVKDGQAFLATLEQVGFTVQEKPGVPGFSHRILPPGNGIGMPILASLTDSYLLATTAPDVADDLKALKPEALLPNRPGAGTVSISIQLDQIPDEYKSVAVGQLEQQIAKDRERRPDENDAEYQGRLAGMKVAQDAMTGLIKDGKEIGLDLRVDKEVGVMGLSMTLGATPGTDLAKSIRAFGASRSLFRGLGRDAALDVWFNLPVAGPLRDAFDAAIASGRKELEKAEADDREFGNKLLDALEPTLRDDVVDFGASLYGPFPAEEADGPPIYSAVFGLKVKEGKRLDALFREAAGKQSDDDKKNAVITLDFVKETESTPAIHKVELLKQAEGQEYFGKREVFEAVTDDVLLVAIGSRGQATLTEALARTREKGEPADSAQMELDLDARRIAPIAGDNPEARAAAKQAAESVFVGENETKSSVRFRLGTEGDFLKLDWTTDVPVLKFFNLVGGMKRAAAGNN